MVRGPYFDRNGLKKGAWSKEEDDKLKAFVQRYGHKNWRQLPKFAGLQRCGKSCRIRWLNYLRPDVKHGGYSKEEDDLIIQLYDQLGSKWSKISEHLPGRTDNEIKNHWHTHLRKRETEQKEISKSKEEQTIESSRNEVIIQGVTEEKMPEINHPIPSHPITILESSHVSPSSSSTGSFSSSSSNAAADSYGIFDGIGYDLYEQGNQYPRSEEDDDHLRAFVRRHGVSIDERSFPDSSPSECSFFSFDHLNYMGIAANPMEWNVDESSNPLEILESDFWTEPFVLDLEINSNTKYDYSVSSNLMSSELNYI